MHAIFVITAVGVALLGLKPCEGVPVSFADGESIGDKIKQTFSGAGEAITDFTKSIQEKVESFSVDDIKNKAVDTYNAATSKVKEFADDVSTKFKEATGQVPDKASEISEQAQEIPGKVADTARDLSGKAKEMASGVAQKAEDAVSGLKDQIQKATSN